MYDYLVVGAGLYGAVFANQAKAQGKSVLVIDKRPNIAGNVFTEKIEGINVHKYGAHIFHTNNKKVWNFVNRFAEFNRFTNSPVANYKGELFSLPFNMYTFNKMWGVVTPSEAQAKIEEQKKAIRAGYDIDIIPSDFATYGRDAKALLKELQSQNERMFLVTFLVLNTGRTEQELENNVFQASSIAQKHNCNLCRLDFQQEQGLMSSLPLADCQIEIQVPL